MTSLHALALLALAAATSGDPLGSLRRVKGQTTVECSGALETVMLLAQLSSPGPSTRFQEQVRARFALQARHPAVGETAALLEHGFGYEDLALLATLMAPAPYFNLTDSQDLRELARTLKRADVSFNLARLYGYAKLVREFYWDNHVGRFLRSSLPYYREVAQRPAPPESPPGARIVISPLAPAARLEFVRRSPRPVTYLVLGDEIARPPAQ